MRTETLTREIFTFDELSERAKEKARDWWRTAENEIGPDHEFMFADVVSVGKILGVEIDQHAISTLGGKTRYEPTIYYSGFCSQGDGACFEGRYSYKKGMLKEIRAYAPNDATLHQIADDLFEAQRKAFYRLEARAKHRGRYQHSGYMSVDVTDSRSGNEVGGESEEAVTSALRAFADWIYGQLEKDYEYRMSDENVDDSIKANEYEFLEDGSRA